ncbi:MAG: hypothetical protein RIC80_10300 [Cyclobacteriaceae bacterium]
MTKTVILSLLLSLLISPLLVAQSYFPLEKGSETTFQYTEMFSRQGLTSMVMRVGEDEKMINGQSYLEIITEMSSSGNSGFSNSSFVRMTDEGLVGLPTAAIQKEELMMPNEFEAGQSWTTSQGKIEIVQTDGNITTPNGNYTDCLVLKTIVAGGGTLSYYQDGIGLVAMGMEQGGKFSLMAYLVE